MGLSNIILLNYNNYYNRIIKKESSLDNYLRYQVGETVDNVNFNPNDDVQTSLVVNWNYEETPDYLIQLDGNIIKTRWFILESKRLRNGQYQLQLKRDTIADSLSTVLNADSFIYKGTLPENDPLIFNSENMPLNQIKKSEKVLKDYTECPWIVAYISPDAVKDASSSSIEGSIEGYYDLEYDKLEDYPFYKYNNVNLFLKSKSFAENFIYAPFQSFGGTSKYIKSNLYLNGIANLTEVTYPQGTGPETSVRWDDSSSLSNPINDITKKWQSITEGSLTKIWNIIPAKNRIDTSVETAITKQNGKIIKIQDKYYKIHVETNAGAPVNTGVDIVIGSEPDKIIQGCYTLKGIKGVKEGYGYPGQKFNTGQIKLYGEPLVLTLEDITETANVFKYDLKGVNLSNSETPYGILCMPYSGRYSINTTGEGGDTELMPLSAQSRLKVIQALGSVSNVLYDIQILPYCPIRNLSISGDTIDVTNSKNRRVRVTNAEGNYLTSVLISSTPSFSFYIYEPITIGDLKMCNETSMWRLCSPNYAGSFDFNPAKFYNNDKTPIKYFDVDCTYRPYTPYIHVAPRFSGLYGKDFNDARGLICGGDFSVDRINDQWATYQYNNKNFQLQFDRQIESMELKQSWNTASSIVNGIGGVATGASAGAIAGSVVPGIGTAVGALVGGAAGLIQGGFNAAEQITIGRDAIDAAKDQFNYNLQNIQARPYGLTKVSTINANNKIYPFLEYYTCTEAEKTALKNKLDFEGMTIMAIRSINSVINTNNEYNKNYVRAKIIRMPDTFKEDAHYLNDINKELMMGVYIND